ncbi:hypothetical protein RJ55_05667 [Drechmeria coniospora]|nr:hypothetical protein RJ55_05667 [Drechmeria coniospora]
MAKRGASALSVASKAIDPTLDALFSSSSGPVKAPVKSRYTAPPEAKAAPAEGSSDSDDDEEEGDDEVLSEISEELDDGYTDEEGTASEPLRVEEDESQECGEDEKQAATAAEAVKSTQPRQERKRKRKDDNDGLEANYLAELAKDDDPSPAGKRPRSEGKSDRKGEDASAEDEDDDVPMHETATQEPNVSEMEKASRTVFLGNVSTDAISSKSAKKTLMEHLSSVLDAKATPPQTLESIRFRSVAFSTGSMPKRAAYITKSLMAATTKSANAYAVFSTTATARKVVSELNGTEVLDRHLRVDSVAHPSPIDHQRCVFVGNLGFVDDETAVHTNSDGKTVEKKRNKVPSDVEEGLWRTFSKQGKVENVRVVRDPKTRVGKGFAYVQFQDGNDVESAVLLDGKKFPPMLPRALRVTRAKDPRKTALNRERAAAKAEAASSDGRNTKYKHKATPEEKAAAGRASKLLGRAGAFLQRKKPHANGTAANMKTPEQIVFEGRRASSRDALSKDLKGKKGKGKKGKGRPVTRATRRAQDWKKKSAK